MMTRLAIVVLFAGLIGPAMAADPETQAPPQKTAGAEKAPGSEKVIADILAVSGIQKTLEKAPGNFLAGFHNSLEKMQREKGGRLPPDLQEAMENSVRESYTPDGFMGRVTRAMKKDYNAKRYQELLADLSTPLALRMADLESKGEPSPQEFSDFNAQLANNPLSAQRSDLLHRLDVASGTTNMVIAVILSSNKGMMSGMANAGGSCVNTAQLKQSMSAMEAKINANRAELENVAITMLAYTYRDVSDADLAEYLRIYEKENSRHIHGVIYAAVVEEYSQASVRMGNGVMNAVKSKRAALGEQPCKYNSGAANTIAQAQTDTADQTGTEQASPEPVPAAASSVPASTEQQGTPVTPKSSIPLEKRQGGDITQCLEAGSKSDKDIAACAEKYRRAK